MDPEGYLLVFTKEVDPTASTMMDVVKTVQEFQKDKGGWYALTDLIKAFLLTSV